MEAQVLQATSVKAQLQDVILDITWSKITGRYFGKSPSWLYNKLNGVNGDSLSYAERLQLRNALYDFTERIRKAADSIA